MNFHVFEILRTIILLTVFVSIVIWAWSSKRKQMFYEAAQRPLRDDDLGDDEHRDDSRSSAEED